MRLNAQRLGLLSVSFLLIGIAVVACASPQPTTPYNSGTGGDNVFQTPASLNSPTPAFPTFTVGAWPSNYSPGNSGTLTIYVICRIQDPTMQTPPKAAANVTVELQFQAAAAAAVNIAPMSSHTGLDGIAAFTFQFSDPTSGVPIVVYASATYNGVSYAAQTFFTPNPVARPKPKSTATANPSPSATP